MDIYDFTGDVIPSNVLAVSDAARVFKELKSGITNSYLKDDNLELEDEDGECDEAACMSYSIRNLYNFDENMKLGIIRNK